MKKKRLIWLGAIGLALMIVCLVAGVAYYLSYQARASDGRPLVLIHSPVAREQVILGNALFVHATARSAAGLARIEFWANDVLLASRDAPSPAPNSMVLTTGWLPTVTGNHVLIVRALTMDGEEGQASLVIRVLQGDDEAPLTHLVQEGETLDSIASDYATTPEELVATNPHLEGEGLSPGDDLVIPDDEPGGEGLEPASEADDEAPLPEAEAPMSSGLIHEFFLDLADWFRRDAVDPMGLQVEFLQLQTSAAYESLHCYIGAGYMPPRWYPDLDRDQTTDESFALRGIGPGGVGIWSIEEHLSGDEALNVTWPSDQALPVSLSCVGITAAGTEALDLGRWEAQIAPRRWTGVVIRGSAAGEGGWYDFALRIRRVGSRGGGPLYLDPEMTSPTNARLDERRISLRWDYDPPAGEQPITGFRIYLNGNLQWVEPASARESGLPYEWFNPPCATTYAFAVTAYRHALPDGPESLPAIALRQGPQDECERQLQITFLTLETFDLGGDGRRPEHSGDVGPVYGHFFANEQRISFDTRSPRGGGRLDRPNGLHHHSIYNLSDLSFDGTWGFNGMPAMVAHVPEGGSFEFGFHIMDSDVGRCNNARDPGCDDLVCEGISILYNNSLGAFDEIHEGALTSEDGRCRVTYRWGPAPGSPVGSGIPGWEPLPWIALEDYVVDEDSGRIQLHIRNTGTATWPWRDLLIELQTRDGDSLGVYTWPAFVLEPGQHGILEHPEMRLDPPFDACVLIDPYDDVPEMFERSGDWRHIPLCPPVPDLIITDARYVTTSDHGQIRITVQNVGEAPLAHRSLAIRTFLADGSPLYIGGSLPNISLERFEPMTFSLGGVSPSAYAQMQQGYSVVVNPDRTIYESDYRNNIYSIDPSVRVRFEPLEFFSGRAGENQLHCRTEVYFEIWVGHGYSADEATWTQIRYPRTGHLTYLTDHFICVGDDPGPWIPDANYTLEVEMQPDENFYIRLRGWEEDSTSDDDFLGEIFRAYGSTEGYGAGTTRDTEGQTWARSIGGYNDDVPPNGGHTFRARWRISLIR